MLKTTNGDDLNLFINTNICNGDTLYKVDMNTTVHYFEVFLIMFFVISTGGKAIDV
jgi:hypothetical protein